MPTHHSWRQICAEPSLVHAVTSHYDTRSYDTTNLRNTMTSRGIDLKGNSGNLFLGLRRFLVNVVSLKYEVPFFSRRSLYFCRYAIPQFCFGRMRRDRNYRLEHDANPCDQLHGYRVTQSSYCGTAKRTFGFVLTAVAIS